MENGATLVIDKSDTGWLKILPRSVGASGSGANYGGDEEDANGESQNDKSSAHSISVLGSLKINSVKISSWDPEKKDYVKFEFDTLPSREQEHTGIDATPRPYIRVEELETPAITESVNPQKGRHKKEAWDTNHQRQSVPMPAQVRTRASRRSNISW